MRTHHAVIVAKAVKRGVDWIKKVHPVYMQFLLARSDFQRARPQNPGASRLVKHMWNHLTPTRKSFGDALQDVVCPPPPRYVLGLRCPHHTRDTVLTLTLAR